MKTKPVFVTEYLHGVVGVFVVKDERFLNELVISLQFVNVGFVVDDVLLVLLQIIHLFFQRAGDIHRHVTDLLITAERQNKCALEENKQKSTISKTMKLNQAKN